MEMKRAYSVLTIKAVDDDQRIITGIATTPEPDRVGDIVDPLGAKFANPLPLLWQHKNDSPVGTVTFDKPTKKGITFKAILPNITEPGALKNMVDLAWQSVKAQLVRGVSIGFRALEYSFMESGGIRYSETEIMELSLVTIPANASATIQSIKAMDTSLSRRGPVRLIQPRKTAMEKLPGGAVRLSHALGSRNEVQKSKTTTTKYSVGDKVKVKPGKDHDGMGKGEIGTIQEISTPALGIKFPSMPMLHKWYADDEVESE